MQRIECTIEEMINLISAKAGAAPISFEAVTMLDLRKAAEDGTRNPYGEVTKTCWTNGWVNCSYAHAFEKDTGTPHSPRGGVWHHASLDVYERLTPFAEYKGNPERLYLRVLRPRTISTPAYVSEKTGAVTEDQLKPFMKDSDSIFKVWALAGLLTIRFDGMELVITGTVASEEKKLEEMMAV